MKQALLLTKREARPVYALKAGRCAESGKVVKKLRKLLLQKTKYTKHWVLQNMLIQISNLLRLSAMQ